MTDDRLLDPPTVSATPQNVATDLPDPTLPPVPDEPIPEEERRP